MTKAKHYIQRIENTGGFPSGKVTETVVDLMKEVHELLTMRHAFNEQGLADGRTILRTVKEINQKWLSIHRHFKMPETLKDFYLEACKREWPQMENFL